jgi:hypothetical protein
MHAGCHALESSMRSLHSGSHMQVVAPLVIHEVVACWVTQVVHTGYHTLGPACRSTHNGCCTQVGVLSCAHRERHGGWACS